MNGAMMAKLKENISKFGVYKPIRVRKIKRVFTPEEMKHLLDGASDALRASVIDVEKLEGKPIETGTYQIVGGHQTVAACRELGIKEVPAVVMELNDYDALQLMLNDNEIHGEHDPMMEARALEQMAEYRTLEEIAEDTVHDKAKLEAFMALLAKEERKAVAFTANKESADFLNLELAYAGDDAKFMKQVLNQTGKGDPRDAVLEIAKHYFQTVGE